MTSVSHAALVTSRTTLPCDSRSPSLSRRVVDSALRAAGLVDLIETALLLVTELVTNAYIHAGTDVQLDVTTTGQALTVEVIDGSAAGLPRVGHAPPPDSEGGRGLLLLDALASEWGTRHFATGKAVWFRLGPTDVAADTHLSAGHQVLGRVPTLAVQPRLDIGWLTRLPAGLEQQLTTGQLVAELLQRMVAALDLREAWVFGQSPEDERTWQQLSGQGGPGAALPAGLVQQLAQDDGSAELPVAAANMRVLPLRGRSGVDGALVLRGRPAVSDDDAALASLVGGRIGELLREDHGLARSERSRSSLTLLAEASELFAGTLNVGHALLLTAQLVVPRFADWSSLSLTGEHHPEKLVVAHRDETRLATLRSALSGPDTATTVARLSAQAHHRPMLAAAADLPADLTREQPGAVLAVPLVARRQQLGLLLVGRPVGSAWTPDDVTLLGELAGRAALAIDNARLYEERTSIADALQALLLPPTLPSVAGVDFGARYTPAGAGNDVGGDFYDVFPLPDDGWGIAIGDVCGKGAAAAAITGMVRDVLRLLISDGATPPQVLRRLNTSILELGDRGRLCTAIAGTVRAAGGGLRIRLSSAGHPPPVLLRAAGQPGLFGGNGTLLGVMPDIDVADDEVHLEPGDALVFYTDGVTESRRGSEMFGDQHLQDCLRGVAGCPAEMIAGRLEDAVRRHSGAESRDDLAILVVSCPPAASSAPGRRGTIPEQQAPQREHR